MALVQHNEFGIDLGTCNIKIYSRAADQVMLEKNMIAIEGKDRLFAYGDSAFEMFEKAPGNIHISFPLSNGVIADINNMHTLIRSFITDMQGKAAKQADYYVAVPTDVTEVEKRAFYDLIKESGLKPRQILIVEKAVADGLGLDIDVKNSQGVLLVNVGYDTTEISLLSLGGIVLSKLIKVGGMRFDEAIRAAVRREYGLVIGAKTAEQVKISLRELEAQGRDAVVYGRDLVTGLPVERHIPPALVKEALDEHFSTIIDQVRLILERTPPELSADIYRQGIYLTGGGSQVANLAQKLAQGTGLNVNTAANAPMSVAMGLARIIKEENYRNLAYLAEGRA